jgi:N-methylhydantoinase A
LAGIARVFAELEAEAQNWLAREGTPPEDRTIQRQASMRYVHQGFELMVPWPSGAVDGSALKDALENFHRLHERLYTFASEDTPVEIVTLRVSAIGRLPVPTLPRLPVGRGVAAAVIGRQDVDFDGTPVDCPVYDRSRLGSGDRIAGPAILRQLDTTTVLLPGQDGEVDSVGNLIVRERA